MRVEATGIGFDGKKIRNPGEVFDIEDGAKGSWFKPVKSEKPARKAKEAEPQEDSGESLV